MIRAIALATILLIWTSALAVADSDLSPSRRNTAVHVEVTKIQHGDSIGGLGRQARATRNNPVAGWFTQCPIDRQTGTYGCRDVDPPEPDDDPEVTEADILRAAREIGMPRLEINIQPGVRTLVNAETIFYAEPQPFERSVTLLGTEIDLVAEPARFTWVHGDGTTASTAKSGRPYPAFDVVHRYREPADEVAARVDVTYRVRYRIEGGAWQELGQTLTAAGPATTLEVREAAPVLTRP